MACATAHRISAAVTMGVAAAYEDPRTGKPIAHPVVGAGLGALLGTLPDLIEPAAHPNHRQFFHSITFALALGYSGYRLYQWEPQTEWQQIAKAVGLIAIGAYLTHLAMDGVTPKSLPLIGKLG